MFLKPRPFFGAIVASFRLQGSRTLINPPQLFSGWFVEAGEAARFFEFHEDEFGSQ